MPAPTNISAATAIDLGALPVVGYTQTVDDAGIAYTVWHKITPLVDGELGFWFFGDLSVYKPTVALFTPDGVTPSTILSSSTNKRVQIPVKGGQTYFFRSTSSTGNVSPAVLHISALMFTPSTVPAGSILINSETTGFPASILAASGADANPIAFQYPFAAGDSCSILPNGISCFEDDDLAHDGSGSSTGITLYDANRVQITTISRAALGLPTGNLSICNNDVDAFYVGQAGSGGTHAKIVRVSSAGVVGGTSWTLPAVGLQCIGVSPDETILYHMGQGGTSGAAVKQWDLVNDVALADLVAGVATYSPLHDLLVFPDGSLLVGYRAAGDGFFRHYSAAGATILQMEKSTTLRSDDRLAFALDNPTSFWHWRHRGAAGATLGMSQFDNIRLSDGTVLDSLPGVQYDAGIYLAAETATPVAEFGHPFSCGFIILRTVSPVMPSPQIDNSVPCCADCSCEGGGIPTGAAGPVTPPVTPFWFRRCTGGGHVPTAADVIDSEDWHDEFPPKEPNSWLTIVGQAGSPENEADERWGLKPLSDRGRFVAGRLDEVGSIERRSSDKDGHYAPARMRLVAQDDDGTFRERLGDPTRRDLIHREARFEILSYAGRKAGLDPIPRIQGRIVDVQPGLDRKAIVEIQDIVGSQFGPLDPQKTVGLEVGDEHPSKPESSKGRIYPILLGEKSDAGATDNTGVAASVGMMPVVDCGDQFLPGETPDPEGRLFNDALTVVDDAADVNLTGTGGTIQYPTRVFVAPIIGGEIGPFSNVPTGFLDPDGDGAGNPSVAHAHRKIWMDIAGGADEYLAVFTKVPGFHPQTNPTVDTNARYKIVSGTPSMPAWPPRNNGIGPQWDFYVDFLDDTDGDQWGVQYVSAPLNLTYTITGTPGTRRLVYAVSAFATLGESPRSAVLVVEDAPEVLDATNNVVLMWDEPADNADAVIAYRIRGRETNPPTSYLRITDGAGSPLTYTDDGTDAEKAFNSGSDGDALVSENVLAWIVCGLGEVDIHEVYGSDGAEGTSPKRRLIPWDEGTIIGPDSPGWPETERYRVVGGIRQSGFYARGLPLKHHREGAVTFAWNGCGWKDDDGLLVNQAFRMLLLFLNEVVEKNNGEGYRDGDFGPIETFANGDPKFWTSKFEDAQEQTMAWLTPGSPGELGYVGTIVVTEPTPLAEIIRRFFNDYGGHGTTNHRGQWYPYLINPAPEAGAGRLYAERREIARLIEHRFAKDEQENRVVYSYDYNYDLQTFRNQNITVEDAASIAAHGGSRIGVFQAGLRECFYCNDQATIEDRWQRHLTLYAYAPRYVQWSTNLKSWADDNGDPARFSHRKEGLGLEGESGTPGQILHTFENMQPYEVIQTAMLFRNSGSP